ncbi:MAG: DUF72 domain-containing protein [Planctomycetota bacterium]
MNLEAGALRERIKVGIAGWSYADWKGIVYARSGVDELRAVAALVDLIEINVSFYRTPDEDRVASWVDRTGDLGTRFAVKLPRAVTHEGRVGASVVEPFRLAFEPLRASGRLDVLLAQYSERFRDSVRAREYLSAVAAAFDLGVPIALELRHPSWREGDAVDAVRELGFRPVFLDWPKLGQGFDGPGQPDSDLAYFRLHGRNREHWGRRSSNRDQVYDHDYVRSERDEIQDRLRRIAESTAKVHVVANNHYQGQAMAVALQLRAWLEGEPIAVPDTLLRHYPALGQIALGGQKGLFGP